MKVVLITGSNGLVGTEASFYYANKGYLVIGVDNNMRYKFFGAAASTLPNRVALEKLSDTYKHVVADIRDLKALEVVFDQYSSDIELVIHTAAQPSHDWAATEPMTDFTVNANGTLNMLELTRRHCPNAVFIFTSTNKVYGDTPNSLPLKELETRYEIDSTHTYHDEGIDETMSIDNTTHSLFGVSKAAADLMVQEYGRYFGMKTAIFRAGCLTGPNHTPAEYHGFLSYLVQCGVTGKEYNIFGYKGKQVRDNLHSSDLVQAFDHFFKNPRVGEIYNMGGGRFSNCSLSEAVAITENMIGKKMLTKYVDENRIGDHMWWISNTNKFKQHYSDWQQTKNIELILSEIYNGFISAKKS
jgi:CDP-paratose 2-epimerase